MNTHRFPLLLAAIALWLPGGAWPQQPARLPTVGILADGGPVTCGSGQTGEPVACMVDELRVLGHIAGRNVTLVYRYAHGDYTRLPALAAELVALRPDVLYTLTTPGADAAATATATIPIVVGPAGEPTMIRLAGNLARPVGNVTGQTTSVGASGEVGQKLLQLLKELAPRTSRVAVIFSPDFPVSGANLDLLRGAASPLGITLLKVEARNLADLGQAFAAIAAGRADAIYLSDASTLAGSSEVRKSVTEWALSRRMPVVAPFSAVAADGTLVTLGADPLTIARRAAFQVRRILGGAKPADLPVERPTVFKLTLNRKTTTALGLTIPQALLLRADKVIE